MKIKWRILSCILAVTMMIYPVSAYAEEVPVTAVAADEIQEETLDNMEAIAFKRGFLMPGKRIDYERTGRTVIDEFRSGKLGRITLETVPSEGEPEND